MGSYSFLSSLPYPAVLSTDPNMYIVVACAWLYPVFVFLPQPTKHSLPIPPDTLLPVHPYLHYYRDTDWRSSKSQSLTTPSPLTLLWNFHFNPLTFVTSGPVSGSDKALIPRSQSELLALEKPPSPHRVSLARFLSHLRTHKNYHFAVDTKIRRIDCKRPSFLLF